MKNSFLLLCLLVAGNMFCAPKKSAVKAQDAKAVEVVEVEKEQKHIVDRKAHEETGEYLEEHGGEVPRCAAHQGSEHKYLRDAKKANGKHANGKKSNGSAK
jgi:hypothetical protein